MSDGGDDPWDFLSAKKREVLGDPGAAAESAPSAAAPDGATGEAPGDVSAVVPEARIERRERGQLRGDMGGPSLRRRGWPMALALALLALAGYLTEVVASSQMLALAGPMSMVVIFPLGGLGLLALALLQFRVIDHRARLPMIRIVSLGYAAAFAVIVALLSQSLVPVVATGAAWLLADQLNFLMPLLVWSLASDEFNVAESRKIYPWIVTWMFGGQVLGLMIAAVSPSVLAWGDIPLTWLLVVPPIVCLVVGLWLPAAMRGSHAAKGVARPESLRDAIASARDFIDGVPVWRPFLLGSVLTFVSGATVYLVFLANAEGVVGSDAATLQRLLGWSGLAWFLITWAIQAWGSERLQNRIGIPGALLVLPAALVVAGVLIGVGSILTSAGASLTLLLIGITFWLVPRWSIDENARRSALAFVPDERRARVSFVVDLIPVALGLIVSGPLALFGVVTGDYWVIAVAAALIAGLALWPGLIVRRDWEDSLLNWRLRRRKQNRTLDFD